MLHMERIGVRELRQNASLYLRRVEAGETIEVTDRGRPVAILAPIQSSLRDRLIAEGRLIPGSRRSGKLPLPVALPPGVEPPSRTLERLREE
jgi:prevent-host-death family protein